VYGAGMFNASATPVVLDCTFSNNIATVAGGGGGIYGNVAATNCEFDRNTNSAAIVPSYGGSSFDNCLFRNHAASAISMGSECAATFTNCTFRDNASWCIAGNWAGVTVRNSRFFGNYGGVTLGHGLWSSLTVSDSVFVNTSYRVFDNAAGSWNATRVLFLNGGNAVYPEGASQRVNLDACVFVGNSIALRSSAAVVTTTTNCIFSGNAGAAGCVVAAGGGAWRDVNSTLVHNRASWGAVISMTSGSAAITNSILWGNSPTSLSGNVTCGYSDIQGGYAGVSNLNADPLFTASIEGTWTAEPVFKSDICQTILSDSREPWMEWTDNMLAGRVINPCTMLNYKHCYIASNDATSIFVWGDATGIAASGKPYTVFDLRLREDSPCIDTATPSGAPSIDIDGRSRPLNGGYDMGAYEGKFRYLPAGTTIYVE